MRPLRIGVAQINPVVGDFRFNRDRIIEYIHQGLTHEIDLLAFPEMCLCGYPPKDLLLKKSFLDENMKSLEAILPETKNITVVVGLPTRRNEIYNSAALLHDGLLVGMQDKEYLPNYGVFDENRYFQSGSKANMFHVGTWRLGLSICEDIWHPEGMIRLMCLAGAEVIINISASPFHAGKPHRRADMLSTRALDNRTIIVYANQVGGQDDLIFDGNSLIIDQDGKILAEADLFSEQLIFCDVDLDGVVRERLQEPLNRQETLRRESELLEVQTINLEPLQRKKKSKPVLNTSRHFELEQQDPHSQVQKSLAEIYRALTLGVHDYVKKNGFRKVVLGLSGGMDSALTLVIAVDALGAENVVGVSMPGPFSSRGSITDAQALSRNMGTTLLRYPITKHFNHMEKTLRLIWPGKEWDTTEENLQSRFRGMTLMALSNKFGYLVLTTGNKSELAVGYATLYGDMAGGLAVLADVPKTLVYKLAQFRNQTGPKPVIPRTIINKPPSAELKANQKDTDSLPEYALLDQIIVAYVEEDWNVQEIVNYYNLEPGLVERIIHLINVNEFKRCQAPLGLRITPRAFGSGRRIPITQHYRELFEP
ncbi:NAD+ synthase [bacterium]|nr:NAD+ synthase [bacterium]